MVKYLNVFTIYVPSYIDVTHVKQVNKLLFFVCSCLCDGLTTVKELLMPWFLSYLWGASVAVVCQYNQPVSFHWLPTLYQLATRTKCVITLQDQFAAPCPLLHLSPSCTLPACCTYNLPLLCTFTFDFPDQQPITSFIRSHLASYDQGASSSPHDEATKQVVHIVMCILSTLLYMLCY